LKVFTKASQTPLLSGLRTGVKQATRLSAVANMARQSGCEQRDNQDEVLSVAQTRKALASMSRHANHPAAATKDSHPDCRAARIQIVAP
jgi:hypothetical protein